MSLTMHLYTPEFCDGNYCCKDCEECHIGHRIEEMESDGYDEPSDRDLEMGFDPYAGCYTDDC